MSPESWRPVAIAGFDHYLVSDHGRVRRAIPARATGYVTRILKPHINMYGYYKVNLHVGLHRYKTFVVHRLVALTFVGPAPVGKSLVCHKDDDKLNNHVSNLFWGSHADNSADMVRKCRSARGERRARRLKLADVLEIRALWPTGRYNQRELGELFGVSQSMIWMIIHNRTWVSFPSQ